VALLSEIHLEIHESFCISNYHFCRNDGLPGRKGGTAVAVKEGIPQNLEDLPLLVSVEATGVFIPIGNSEVLLVALHEYPERAWNRADVTELSSLGRKCTLDICIYLIYMNLNFQPHNVPLITLLRRIVTFSILWSKGIFSNQMSFSLMSWAPTTYQSYPTY
jgi:hypothetical protein